LAEVLRSALKKRKIRVAFVFGSIATNEERARSDVDLMVIVEVGLRELVGWLMGASEQMGREINPHAMSLAEFRRRKRSGDHFLTSVLDAPKLFIIGSVR